MRERITYIQKLGDGLDPSTVRVDAGAIRAPDVHAVREDRLTLTLDELPEELRTLLGDTQDLHIRWVSTDAYETVSPLLARLPPGLHVFFTPGDGNGSVASGRLCSVLGEAFRDIACTTLEESFTPLPRDRFSHAAAYQYFQQLDSLQGFIGHAKDRLCGRADKACAARLDGLSRAASLDISYESQEGVLRVTALWPYQRQPIDASSRPGVRTEVGILSADKPKTLEPHELGVAGLLTVLGQDPKPSATMFSFAARHRDAESTFSARFLAPTGLHPTLQLRISSAALPAEAEHGGQECSPYAYLTLPRTIFADKYQLSDPLFLASKNLAALRHTTQPVDLEAPEYAVSSWGSAILLELAPPSSPSSRSSEWTAEVPLHLRYLAPSSGGYSTVSVPYPAVFWACQPLQDDELTPGPFEKKALGYDGLFEDGTVFWHVAPQPAGAGGQGLLSQVRVPVLDVDRAGWVGAGTGLAVAAGFAFVAWKLAGVLFGKKEEVGEKKTQ
ncbi:hypothetical protein VTJ83DRAFT_2615 [Remersonia thermophila]|uniref:Protein PBN1 n=1 Tax=Remersonia thermophila TaxID=72144 RepID=A0ABR4DJI0_9PEZI